MHRQYRKYKENHGFLTDRWNQAEPKMTHREGTPVQGLNLYKKKGLVPQGLNIRKTNNFSVRPQTDTIRLVSSKLVLWWGSRPPGRPFWPIFWKMTL